MYVIVLSLLMMFGPRLIRAAEQASSVDEILARVAAIHGAAGLFAVAGYRMGERALPGGRIFTESTPPN